MEAYDDEPAFNRHLDGPHARKFLDRFREFEVKPPAKGTRNEDAGRAAQGLLKVFTIDEVYNRLCQADEDGEFAPPHPENFLGTVRIMDLAAHAGPTGIDMLAVFFDANARTKPHVHTTEQILYFVRGNGFVAFPGQAEQVVEAGGIVIVPASELHMHGATRAGPTCHVAARMPSDTNWTPHVPAEWQQFVEDG